MRNRSPRGPHAAAPGGRPPCGGLDFDHPGFSHTVLVDMRARLAGSEHPERIFEVALGAAREAGLVGRRRVLDSTPLYDAVATMDTVTLLRSGIRGLLRVAGEREDELRSLLGRDDDYRSGGKPAIDWEDAAAREALIDAVATDASALLVALEGEAIDAPLAEAAALLATLLGQDLETDGEGTFRIARRVAPDRIVSTVDPDARHGHKTQARSFDGYKGHVAIDPDSEIVTATAVTPGNGGDAAVAPELLEAELEAREPGPGVPPVVYGDAGYGSGALLETLETAAAEPRIKVQPSVALGGRFSKDDFAIDREAATVTCPAALSVPLRARRRRAAEASFGSACAACPLAARCTGRESHRDPHPRQREPPAPSPLPEQEQVSAPSPGHLRTDGHPSGATTRHNPLFMVIPVEPTSSGWTSARESVLREAMKRDSSIMAARTAPSHWRTRPAQARGPHANVAAYPVRDGRARLGRRSGRARHGSGRWRSAVCDPRHRHTAEHVHDFGTRRVGGR